MEKKDEKMNKAETKTNTKTNAKNEEQFNIKEIYTPLSVAKEEIWRRLFKSVFEPKIYY